MTGPAAVREPASRGVEPGSQRPDVVSTTLDDVVAQIIERDG
jgi:hypothetical protein